MVTREERAYKKWLEAGISDNFIFSKTMELYPDLCKELIEKILHIKIREIKYPEREKVLEERLDAKGVRLDVYVEDENNRSFDIEMQIAEVDKLEKRMRYYQGLIDMDKLKHGAKYRTLGESYIIFICLFDYFGQGRHIYTFNNRCEEDINLRLNDGATKIFLNTEGILNDSDEDLKNFLDYVAGRGVIGNFAEKINTAVQEVKLAKKWRLDYMTFELMMQELEEKVFEKGLNQGIKQGIERGIKKGLNQGTENIAKKMLNLGMSFEDICKITELSIKRIKELAKSIKN